MGTAALAGEAGLVRVRELTGHCTGFGWPGSGTPVVMVPGFLGDRRIFEPTARLLGTRHAVLTVDLPPGAPREAAGVLAEQLGGWLDGPARFVAGSFGGLVLRCLPDALVRSRVTVGMAPARRFVPDAMVVRRKLLGLLPAPVVEGLYRRRLRSGLPADGVEATLAATLAARGLTRDLLLARFDGVLEWDLPRWSESPHLWLLGANDPEVSWSREEILEEEPTVILGTVPGGHRPYASHPGPFVTRLEDFWRSEGG